MSKKSQPAILVNLERCTGCWTCSVACRVGNGLPEGSWWNYVRTVGSGSATDEPSGEWPDVHMSWMPIYTSSCILCVKRTRQGLEPFCTTNCPTGALTYGDASDPTSPISIRLGELRKLGYRVYNLPAWEHTRPEIYYAEKR